MESEKLTEMIDKKLKEFEDTEIKQTNIDYFGKLTDAKKDLLKIKKLEMEVGDMRLMPRGNYGTYGGGRSRDSRGRYMEGGRDNYGTYENYGRRYRGDDMIDEMAENYGAYMENRENGRYGSPEMEKSFDYMLKSAEDFFDHLFQEADDPRQIEKIKNLARKIAEKRM